MRAHLEEAAVAVCLVGFVLVGALSLAMGLGILPVARETRVMFDVASEANVWTWLSVAVLTTAGYTHLLAAFIRWRERRPLVPVWVMTAATILAMSLDDLATFHERLEPVGEAMGGGDGLFHFSWVVPGMAISLAILMAFTIAVAKLDGYARNYLAGGIGLFFLGAIGLELAGGHVLDAHGYGVTYVLLNHLEEGLEALGSTFLLAAGIADLPRPMRDAGRLTARRKNPGSRCVR